jgi:hypothetical protein
MRPNLSKKAAKNRRNPKGNKNMSTFINWVIDTLASEDVIDLYFILTDLVDIPISEAEQCETAYFDAMASAATVQANSGQNNCTPLGKLVL